jgi:hypothetical protein
MMLIEITAAVIAVSLTADGLRKLTEVDAFARWLRSGEMPWAARRPVVYALAVLEVAAGIGSIHPAGRMVAIGLIVAVTPIGAVLVKRTGVCACRGVVRSNTARQLVIRNGSAAGIALVTLVAMDAPVSLPAVLAAGSVWTAVLMGQHLVLTTAALREVAR